MGGIARVGQKNSKKAREERLKREREEKAHEDPELRSIHLSISLSPYSCKDLKPPRQLMATNKPVEVIMDGFLSITGDQPEKRILSSLTLATTKEPILL